MNLWLTITASFASGILGVMITLIFQRRTEIRRQKIEILRELAGYRFTLIEGGKRALPAEKARFASALNQVFIIYAGDKVVLNALREFQVGAVNKVENTTANDRLSLFSNRWLVPPVLISPILTIPFS
jgi:hypothetical protein